MTFTEITANLICTEADLTVLQNSLQDLSITEQKTAQLVSELPNSMLSEEAQAMELLKLNKQAGKNLEARLECYNMRSKLASERDELAYKLGYLESEQVTNIVTNQAMDLLEETLYQRQRDRGCSIKIVQDLASSNEVEIEEHSSSEALSCEVFNKVEDPIIRKNHARSLSCSHEMDRIFLLEPLWRRFGRVPDFVRRDIHQFSKDLPEVCSQLYISRSMSLTKLFS